MGKETVTMYRPAGQKEMDLVIETGYKQWPPRLPEQPIFYPVINEAYANEVNNWNIKDSGVGYVTRFEVNKSFADKYEIKCVGAAHHTEWWIPAEDLDALNQNIDGKIEIIGKYTEIQ